MTFRRNSQCHYSEGSEVFYIAVDNRRILLPDCKLPIKTATAELIDDSIGIGEMDGIPVIAGTQRVGVSDQGEATGWLSLRDLLAQCESAIIEASILAVQRLEFRDTSRYCTRCATPMEALSDTGVRCRMCGHATYPHVTPAVLVLIENDNRQTLLAQKDGWGKRYSVIAGFVEPGESLEQCCIREAYEEVGVRVSDVRYVGSQPWPFPHQLMVAFRVRWGSGEIECDRDELADARWFSVDRLPELPPAIALSRMLIQHWVDIPSYP